MPLTIGIDAGRAACAESVEAFCRAAAGFSEYELFGASRCHGWMRLDVVTHVLTGWQEMLQGMVAPVDASPSVDAASYWRAFEGDAADQDPLDVLLAQKRRSLAYGRPAAALRQLEDVAEAVRRGIDGLPDRTLTWQGHVFSPGDFLAIWAVEDAVHQLDLRSEVAVPASALGMARRTVEALVGETLPDEWDDEQAVLVGTGRIPVPEGHPALAERLPVL